MEGAKAFQDRETGDSEYLIKALGRPLQEALCEICQMRPDDPIEYLALWLKKHTENVAIQKQEQEEQERLAKEQHEAEMEKRRQLELRDEARHLRNEEERRKMLFLRRSQEIDELYRRQEEERCKVENEKSKDDAIDDIDITNVHHRPTPYDDEKGGADYENINESGIKDANSESEISNNDLPEISPDQETGEEKYDTESDVIVTSKLESRSSNYDIERPENDLAFNNNTSQTSDNASTNPEMTQDHIEEDIVIDLDDISEGSDSDDRNLPVLNDNPGLYPIPE